MSRSVLAMITLLSSGALGLMDGSVCQADFGDFTQWTAAQDPPNANFVGSSTAATATLRALDGTIPAGTDIGFQSANGSVAATSNAGYVFSHTSDFAIAIDYAISTTGAPMGLIGLGFGVGEDAAGTNSAGMGLLLNSGSPLLSFAGAARVNDANLPAQLTSLPATLTGAMFVSYSADTGNITVGASQTAGAAVPTADTTFSGLQNQWSDQDLLAVFFLRSEGYTPGGEITANFSNLRVLSGAPMAVPEPGSFVSMLAFGLANLSRRRRRTTLQRD